MAPDQACFASEGLLSSVGSREKGLRRLPVPRELPCKGHRVPLLPALGPWGMQVSVRRQGVQGQSSCRVQELTPEHAAHSRTMNVGFLPPLPSLSGGQSRGRATTGTAYTRRAGSTLGQART